jgi:hypothetical protein
VSRQNEWSDVGRKSGIFAVQRFPALEEKTEKEKSFLLFQRL